MENNPCTDYVGEYRCAHTHAQRKVMGEFPVLKMAIGGPESRIVDHHAGHSSFFAQVQPTAHILLVV